MFARVSKHWRRALVSASGAMLVCAMFSSPASAQQGWDKKTMVTFSAPVEIPGISAQVLPAGTYVSFPKEEPENRKPFGRGSILATTLDRNSYTQNQRPLNWRRSQTCRSSSSPTKWRRTSLRR
jgi:hypothetical protein